MKNQSEITIDHQVMGLSQRYLLTVGGPVARKLLAAIAKHDWATVIGTKVNPRLYDSYEEFRRDYLACELLRKFPGFPVDIDRVAKATDAFFESERTCWITNRRLYPYLDNFGYQDERVHAFIKRVRKKVSDIIGEKPPEIADFCDFGPGATYDCRGKSVLPADKLETKPTRTKGLFSDVAHLWIWGMTKWSARTGYETRTVNGNRFTTVPKDSEKDRGICIEPTLNLYIQKGYGVALRDRLRKAGIDLVRGQEINGEMARWASLTGSYATIDLSSASDTVSLALVRLLLPPQWTTALESARSPMTYVKGKWVLLEKFSSMGNGFTFELETLIFAAICGCIVDEDLGEDSLGKACFVYGDDIIVPNKLSREVVAALSFFGFSVNGRKTFTNGFFRESCGSDSFGGQVVRPFRIDSIPDGPEWWIATANGISRALGATEGPYSLPWRYAISQLPLPLRKLRGPERLGDGVLFDPNWAKYTSTGTFLRSKKPGDQRFSDDTLWTKALLAVTKPIPWKYWTEDIQLEARLMTISDHRNGHQGRGCNVERRIGWVSVS